MASIELLRNSLLRCLAVIVASAFLFYTTACEAAITTSTQTLPEIPLQLSFNWPVEQHMGVASNRQEDAIASSWNMPNKK